jgi:hypothetical protein
MIGSVGSSVGLIEKESAYRKPKSGLGIRRADLKFGHYIRSIRGLVVAVGVEEVGGAGVGDFYGCGGVVFGEVGLEFVAEAGLDFC